MISTMKKFFNFCSEENRKKFYMAIVLTLFQVIFEGLKVPAIYILVDALLKNEVTSRTAFICLVIMLVSIAGSIVVKNKCTILQTEGGYHTCANKRMEIADHLRYVPMGYFNSNSLGKIISVTTNTMQSLENIATRTIMMVSTGILSTAIITVLIFIFDYRIGICAAIGIGVFAVVNHLLIRESEKASPLKDKADEDLIDQLVEYIGGITEVRNFHLFGKKSKRLNEANDISAAINYKMEITFVPLITLQTLAIKITGVAMLLCAIWFYLNNTMELSVCIVMIIASYIMYSALESCSVFSALIRMVNLAVDKANAILNIEQMNIDGDKADITNRNIFVENVSFSYEQKKIIDNVSFEIPEKTRTAIVGPSGGGKTTLVNLIARFWDVDNGKITLGGKNINSYDYDTLMNQFSFVFQNVYLFNNTIANNIRFGEPDAPMEKVIDAAEKACCHDFIMSLPDGYETVIGDDGVNLSGGERQRISIARAIMKDAPIIILDEATANVDPENEELLMKAIDELTKNKTIIMIAHRLKTVQTADQILVVDKGQIVQKGTHHELMMKDGIYKGFIEGRKSAVGWKIV